MSILCGCLVSWFCMLLCFGILFRLVSRNTNKLSPGPVGLGLPVVGSLFQLGHMPNESLAGPSKRTRPELRRPDRDGCSQPVRPPRVDRHAEPELPEMTAAKTRNNELFTPKKLEAMRGLREEKDVADLESESAVVFKAMVWGILKAAPKPNVADYFSVLRLVDPQGLRHRLQTLFKHMYAFFDELIEKRYNHMARRVEEG
ncbi:hypothetical protein EJ110_NYTH22467 [Nymphaea thermarum]|nr:hypothetical protein EJ110_NYTH22467 [Nymphaea thermarum]